MRERCAQLAPAGGQQRDKGYKEVQANSVGLLATKVTSHVTVRSETVVINSFGRIGLSTRSLSLLSRPRSPKS